MTNDKRKGVVAGYKKLGPTARFLFIMSIVSMVSTVFGFVLGLFSSEYYYIRSQKASRNLANVTMSRPVPFVCKFPVVIDDGSNIQTMPAPGRYVAAFSRTPFSFHITPDGSINLHGEIRDAKGTIVVEATGGSIRVVQTNKFDVNSDSKAIEVVDSNQRPLFQLIVIPYEVFVTERAQLHSELNEKLRQRIETAGITNANTLLLNNLQEKVEELKEKGVKEVIRLSYITQQGETWLISSPHGSEMVEVLEEYDWSKIPRLFCYPGHLHPGKRVVQK